LTFDLRKFIFLAKIKLEGPETSSSCQKDFIRSENPYTSSHIFSKLKGLFIERISQPEEE